MAVKTLTLLTCDDVDIEQCFPASDRSKYYEPFKQRELYNRTNERAQSCCNEYSDRFAELRAMLEGLISSLRRYFRAIKLSSSHSRVFQL